MHLYALAILLVALLIPLSFFTAYGSGEFGQDIFKGNDPYGGTVGADPSQQGVQCSLSDSQLQETNRLLGSIGLPPIDEATSQDIEECKQRAELQGRTVLDNNQVEYSTGYTQGKLDAQMGKFGASSLIPININTVQSYYVQGYLQGFYDTYILIWGVAPW